MTDKLDVLPEKLQSPGESDDAASVHDAMFFKAFSKPEHAAAELKCIFKPALVARIDWDTFKPLSIKFVDAKLTGR